MTTTEVAIIIPVRLASTRFPRKALYPICGIPMLEHVRTRAEKIPGVQGVYVATADQEIMDLVQENGGQVIPTHDDHLTGTDRAAEAAQQLDVSHVLLLQSDEPLILPEEVGTMVKAIHHRPDIDFWNAVSHLSHTEELDSENIVKCLTDQTGGLLLCFRRSPMRSPAEQQLQTLRKVRGIYAFSKQELLKLGSYPVTPYSKAESIEQMKTLERGHRIQSVTFESAFPEVNHMDDLIEVQAAISDHHIQDQWIAHTRACLSS